MAVRWKETTSDRSPTISPGLVSVGGISFSLIGCYRIQVAFSVSAGCIDNAADLALAWFSYDDLELVVRCDPSHLPPCGTCWIAVANGSEDCSRVARHPLAM